MNAKTTTTAILAMCILSIVALILVVAILGMMAPVYAADAEGPFCFESRPTELGWTDYNHHTYVLWSDTPLISHGGTSVRRLSGYGYDDAEDIVPVSASAVRPTDGRWIVQITSTLYQKQQGMPMLVYYAISEYWEMDMAFSLGWGHVGNLSGPFMAETFPGAEDDSFDIRIQGIDCAEISR